jgi:hypothetical protein
MVMTNDEGKLIAGTNALTVSANDGNQERLSCSRMVYLPVGTLFHCRVYINNSTSDCNILGINFSAVLLGADS